MLERPRISRLAVLASGGLLLLAVAAGTGCVSSSLAKRIVTAPNLQESPSAMQWFAQLQPKLDSDYYSVATRIAVKRFPAQIAVALLEPGDYKLVYDLKVTQDGPEARKAGIHLSFSATPREKDAAPLQPKGTIFLLHGVMMNKESMLHWGFFLAQKGYRAVLVDLRGHGQSTGSVITYGARECGDLSEVLDELSARHLIAGRVGVLGVSYGGALGIQWAAREPRVDAVVALAPFCDAREAIGEFAHALFPTLVDHLGSTTLATAFDRAAKRGQFTWEQVDVLAAARHLRQPVLLFHGANDTWVPRTHSDRIKAVAPAGSVLRIGPGNHLTLSLRLSPIAESVAAWFDRGLN